jgi:glycosyltransferase involved in cell wall biosynthesis
MRILSISSRFPYPALKGEQVILYNRLKHLSKRHEITLLTFYQDDRELKHLEQLKQYCRNVETIRIRRFESIYNLLFFSAFSKLPLQSLYFKSNKFKQCLNQLLDSVDFDVVHTYMLRMAEYTRHIGKPKVVDLIDCMQLNLENRLAFLKYPQKILYSEELKRIKLYEKEIVNEYDASIVVSDVDRDYLDSNEVVAIPLGINTDLYKRNLPLPHNQTIIFSGNMAYYPNESAIVWFLENSFTKIKRSVPGVKLKIVGINPGSRVKKYHDGKTIVVTGFVESVTNEMTTSQVAIAPMQSGYGMHIKLLEAMACELPVVCSSLALGTIRAVDGKDVVVADNGSYFADRCIELLLNYEKARDIGSAARTLITREYSWESHTNMIESLYNRLTSKIK